MVQQERCFFQGRELVVELHGDFGFRLRYADLVEYVPGTRTLRGRSAAYPFRSVEQLRYDFEQDVRAVGGDLG